MFIRFQCRINLQNIPQSIVIKINILNIIVNSKSYQSEKMYTSSKLPKTVLSLKRAIFIASIYLLHILQIHISMNPHHLKLIIT